MRRKISYWFNKIRHNKKVKKKPKKDINWLSRNSSYLGI